MLGWLGVALTGSDTSSNVLFGGLQKITAEQLGLSPVLMAAANSSGGVMGKMIDAQSIVVASTATQWYGHEGEILRYVFFHSLALAALMGLLIMAQAYVWPFTSLGALRIVLRPPRHGMTMPPSRYRAFAATCRRRTTAVSRGRRRTYPARSAHHRSAAAADLGHRCQLLSAGAPDRRRGRERG